jgi:hypothetical protein
MKKCICGINGKDKFEDNKLGIILGACLLFILLGAIAVVSPMAFGALILVLILLLTAYAYPKIKKGHSKYCSFRYALLEILSLGNVISF